MNVYILPTWHEAPYMFDRNNIVATEFTQVAYSSGIGCFSIMGYIQSISDDQVCIVLDNVFNINTGSHPTDEDGLMCDAVKDAISSVISKTIAIAKIEFRYKADIDKSMKFIVEELPFNQSFPNQLLDIHKWEVKKLILDYNAEVVDCTSTEKYFLAEPKLSVLSEFCSKWDQFHNISSTIVDQLISMTSELEKDDESYKDYATEITNEIDFVISRLSDLKSHM